MPKTQSKSSRAVMPVGRRIAALAAVALTALAPVLASTSAGAQAAIGLGTADSFAILAGSGITNTNATTIAGDRGTFPTPTQTGTGSITQSSGTDQADSPVTQQAKNDLTTAFNTASAAAPETAVTADLVGLTLTPGVYASNTFLLTGTVTLDTLGDPNALFVFKTNSSLDTASGSNMVVANGGQACNVFWVVPSSATLGTNSNLIGTVMATTSITAASGATIQGRLLAQNGAVTLDNNTITRQTCAPTPTTAAPATTTATTAATAPATTAPGSATPTAVPRRSGTPTGRRSGTPTTNPDGSIINEAPPELAFSGIDSRFPIAGLATVVGGAALVTVADRRRRRVTQSGNAENS